MKAFGLPRRRGLLAAGLAAACVTGMAVPASAAFAPDTDDWGTIVPNAGCVQADAWIAKVEGLGKIVNTALFESHFPAIPTAPERQGGGKDLVNLTIGGFGLGKISALSTRAAGNQTPGQPGVNGGALVPSPCAVYAEAGGASADIGIPYVASPAGGVPLSPIGVHAEAIAVNIGSKPGGTVEMRGGAVGAYISSFGKKIIEIPKIWPVNFGARIPADYSQPALALASTNEQVTTDAKGAPTLDATGHYKYDPKATSGYITAIHASVLGTNAADATIGHAAVIRQPTATPMPMPMPMGTH